MESIKKYLPLIVIAVVGFILLRMFRGSGAPSILPQTQITETPYTEPNAQFRLPAFEALTQIGISQTQAEAQARSEKSAFDSLLASLQNALSIETLRQQTQQQAQTFQRDLTAQAQTFYRDLTAQEQVFGQERFPLSLELTKYLQEKQLDFNRFLQESYLRELDLRLAERENDRQAQQAAIDRISGGRNTSSIIGSISSALSGIFGGQRGGSIFTPPTFPGFFGF